MRTIVCPRSFGIFVVVDKTRKKIPFSILVVVDSYFLSLMATEKLASQEIYQVLLGAKPQLYIYFTFYKSTIYKTKKIIIYKEFGVLVEWDSKLGSN